MKRVFTVIVCVVLAMALMVMPAFAADIDSCPTLFSYKQGAFHFPDGVEYVHVIQGVYEVYIPSDWNSLPGYFLILNFTTKVDGFCPVDAPMYNVSDDYWYEVLDTDSIAELLGDSPAVPASAYMGGSFDLTPGTYCVSWHIPAQTSVMGGSIPDATYTVEMRIIQAENPVQPYLDDAGTILSSTISLLGAVVDVIAAHPLLLFPCLLPMIGLGIGFFRRLM